MLVMRELLTEIRNCVADGKTTVPKLAEACGCTKQHLYNVLNGESQITVGLAEKIAENLGFELHLRRKRKKSAA